MGVALRKYCAGKTEFKRLRLNFYTSFGKKDSDDSNQISPFKYSGWEHLPYVALVEIYQCLSNKDRFNLSLTCRAWSRPFSSPEVWRHAKFIFNGIEDWRARHFSSSMASALRHLVIECRDEGICMIHSAKGSACCLYTFLDGLLRGGNSRLITLKLTNMGCLSRWYQRKSNQDIVEVLGDLLSIQTNLKLLDLSGAGFNEQQGLYILTRVALSCAPTITVLTIKDFFSSDVNPSTTDWLQAFTNLTELTLSYQQLSDVLLGVLSVSRYLMRLNVFVLTDVKPPSTSSEAWENLKRSRPGLTARYCIQKDMVRIDILKNVFVYGIPLVDLEIGCTHTGTFWFSLSTHIYMNFKNHLRRVHLRIEFPMLWPGQVLHKIIYGCPLLEEISITYLGVSSSLKASIERSVRDALADQPASPLRKFTFNGVDVKLELNWIGLLVDKLQEKVNKLPFRW